MAVRYLTLNEAAIRLGVVPPTLAKWAKEGKVPGLKTPGGQWRFAEDDLILALRPVNDRKDRSHRKNSSP